VPHNRALKAAMRTLLAVPTLDKRLQRNLLQHLRRFHDVSDVELSAHLLRSVQLHRNVSRYAFLMDVCALIERCLIPDESTGQREFRPFTASEQEMGRIFELFVRRFLTREQSWFAVDAPHIDWDVDPAQSSSLAWLPTMRTDILLSNAARRVVVETKYYATAYSRRHGTAKLYSFHLYQLLAYVSQISKTVGPEPCGVLLYAGTGPGEALHYRIGGRTFYIRSINLNQPWECIHQDLIALASEFSA
jgi:5-methylcytosine-specific restriction enzyme subunit McrC